MDGARAYTGRPTAEGKQNQFFVRGLRWRTEAGSRGPGMSGRRHKAGWGLRAAATDPNPRASRHGGSVFQSLQFAYLVL